MEIEGTDLLRAAFLNVLANQLPDGRLRIGGKDFEQWPESVEVAGIIFTLTEVEDEVMAVYFPD